MSQKGVGYCLLIRQGDPDLGDVRTKEVQLKFLFGFILQRYRCDDMSFDVLENILKWIKNIFVIKHIFPIHGIYVRLDSLPENVRKDTWRCEVVREDVDWEIIKYPGNQWTTCQWCSHLRWCEECHYQLDEYDSGDDGNEGEECTFCDDRIAEVSGHLLHNHSRVMSAQTAFELEAFLD
jgi:hypothetical protein